jgi:hypothetical protein
MKVARLVCAALALSFIAGWATSSSACDNHKSTKAKVSAATASTKAAACSPAMAANCTPEMMAACKASLAAGGPDLCAGMKASAATAGGACGAKGTKVSMAFVSANGADHCGSAKASAVTASAHGACGSKSASATAVTAVNGASSSNTVFLAGANGSCGVKGARTSTAAAGQCSGHGMASMAATSGHADCEACVDMADCSGQLDAAGAHRQAVRLKNGIMYVYTADSPRTVSAVQAAVSRRAERIIRFASAGEKTRLCAECKAMRGAMASGKLNREVVNIEGGSLTLVTSNDPAVVAKIHAMADDKVAARVKS